MTEEKQGAAEWLRGIVKEYEASGAQICSAMAKMFGIDCEYETCNSCMVKLMTAIADRIDAERALPEGIEWPRFEDGELVKVGDEVEFDGDAWKVSIVRFCADGWVIAASTLSADAQLRGNYGERVKRPTSKVLGADGVPIKVGDAVWATYDGRKYVVKAVCSDGSLNPERATDDGCMVKYEEGGWDFAKKVTHERPDSWERLEEDAYHLVMSEYLDTPEEDVRDIVRRAKALAKEGEQG